jgi:hypothetical protein
MPLSLLIMRAFPYARLGRQGGSCISAALRAEDVHRLFNLLIILSMHRSLLKQRTEANAAAWIMLDLFWGGGEN